MAIPTRTSAESWVRPAEERAINRAYHIFKGKLRHVEYLIGYEENSFAFTGNIDDDLLSITSVYPMREEGVNALLSKAGSDWSAVEMLIEEQRLRALPAG